MYTPLDYTLTYISPLLLCKLWLAKDLAIRICFHRNWSIIVLTVKAMGIKLLMSGVLMSRVLKSRVLKNRVLCHLV